MAYRFPTGLCGPDLLKTDSGDTGS